MVGYERQNQIGGFFFIYVKADLNSTILQTETITNVAVTFLQLNTHLRMFIIGLITSAQ